MDVNEAKEKVVEMNTKIGQVDFGFENQVLALHESATKIWEAKDLELKQKRVVNALISVLLLADSLKISDVSGLLERRLVELEKETL
ncbi:MAG: hypothetical protein HYV41_00615 [Candidatus Magasanikbacteria bacterium]|nr:hypothetical protein [Candidatus Magasanikbacteria bacterium]